MFHPGMINQLMGGSSGGQNSVLATPETSNYAGVAATLQAQCVIIHQTNAGSPVPQTNIVRNGGT